MQMLTPCSINENSQAKIEATWKVVLPLASSIFFQVTGSIIKTKPEQSLRERRHPGGFCCTAKRKHRVVPNGVGTTRHCPGLA